MKHSIKNLFALSLLAAAITMSTGASAAKKVTDTTIESVTIEAISADEEAGLVFMREEEKLARDVYITLYQTWGVKVFDSVSQSEQTHTDAIKDLLEKYQIADPVLDDTVGVYTDYHFTEVYEALVTQGNESLEAALQVGTLIEELDIKDIAEAIAVVDGNDDIVGVYEELMKGSRNHLRSFWDVLTSKGFTYVPQYISQEEFDAIVNSPMER